jgi:hypothetical protein
LQFTQVAAFNQTMSKLHFFAVDVRIAQSTELTFLQKFILGYVHQLAKGGMKCFAGNQFFSDSFGVSERYVRREVNDLVNREILRSVVSHGNNRELSLTQKSIAMLAGPPRKEQVVREKRRNNSSASGNNSSASGNNSSAERRNNSSASRNNTPPIKIVTKEEEIYQKTSNKEAFGIGEILNTMFVNSSKEG